MRYTYLRDDSRFVSGIFHCPARGRGRVGRGKEGREGNEAERGKRATQVERSTTRGVKLTWSIQIEKVPIIVRAFFALTGDGEESTNGGEERRRK